MAHIRATLVQLAVLGIGLHSAEAFTVQPGATFLHGARPRLGLRCGHARLQHAAGRAQFPPAIFGARMDDERVHVSPLKQRTLPRVPDLPTRFPMPERVVAIGDVHGDVDALRQCLRMSKLIDDKDSWSGGGAHLVQVGDILDRGEEERSCIDLMLRLRREAEAAGGHVHLLLGNHEIMNVDLDFRYVTSRHAWEGWQRRSEKEGGLTREDEEAGAELAHILRDMGWPRLTMDRVEAFRPGGHVTMEALAQTSVAVVIGQTVFVHGGLTLEHARYGLERLNWETRAWLVEGSTMEEFQRKPAVLDSIDAPVWNRQYSTPTPKPEALEELEQVLLALRARRMVMGHTPQLRGINAVFSQHGYEAWRCDTGMSRAMMGGPVEVLEILKDGTIHVITPDGIVPAAERSPERVGGFVDLCDVGSGLCTPLPEELAKLRIGEEAAEREESRAEERDAVKEVAKSAKQEELMFGVEVGKGHEEKDRERKEAEWRVGRKEVVAKLRQLDKEHAQSGAEGRLRVLLHAVLEDAAERKDEGLCKLAVKEMLGEVMGKEAVRRHQEELFRMIERLAPPRQGVHLNASIVAKLDESALAKAKAKAAAQHPDAEEVEVKVKGEVVMKRKKSKVTVKNGVEKQDLEAIREREREATVRALQEEAEEGGLAGKERVKRTLARILLDAAERKDASMTRRHVREMLEAVLGEQLVAANLALTWAELDRLVASALPAMGGESYLESLTAGQVGRSAKDYHLVLSPKPR